jgi:peroxiredoxin Q/BCP
MLSNIRTLLQQNGDWIPILSMSKRWTFITDPDLRIRAIEKDVDPVLDAKRVAETLKELQTRVRASP